ncbi:hypothetical protein CSC67_08575 [Pusillimonas caeni]|uniref:hypothetical protein n=1 Tax=Pusillimonas caeni TaxID=1348472 RepID=UPI000E59E19D|nr:hypothetical protein [Pusillimonas caeni]TFL14197.1 hypothetical protein CSC67_08575 [Pusillimonas caeni]
MNGQQLADIGIETARQHAEAVTTSWTELVMARLEAWAPRQHEPFALEDFRFHIERHFEELIPPSPNAWGVIGRLGVSRGILKPTREYRSARSPGTHGHPVPTYTAAQKQNPATAPTVPGLSNAHV